ncbi:hypothetical protein J3Q64DRAFT_1823818 [Phycomyces blakesleeanus]|uniref:Uncharacterized protein n=2 Tax=Phycomyces blakesleeanus TaxID=4837 RepID=A0A162VBE5_PHYB8|nr:hypothetical protein PHYBLDRAFT_72617 [Phycomyces blakesleeanus NRRL 1555(-)]OAD81473.1 hypothetical protein PHYBLDRAFT_72617 [Phycomyces blakesleeanus NRRL 1555(-)]|eukprot:XP_018299513.1 hypothetical protein PHYBLDRAFT_72617 [Phycomyces blakesleeanus NRRL 1555(-)]
MHFYSTYLFGNDGLVGLYAVMENKKISISNSSIHPQYILVENVYYSSNCNYTSNRYMWMCTSVLIFYITIYPYVPINQIHTRTKSLRLEGAFNKWDIKEVCAPGLLIDALL